MVPCNSISPVTPLTQSPELTRIASIAIKKPRILTEFDDKLLNVPPLTVVLPPLITTKLPLLLTVPTLFTVKLPPTVSVLDASRSTVLPATIISVEPIVKSQPLIIDTVSDNVGWPDGDHAAGFVHNPINPSHVLKIANASWEFPMNSKNKIPKIVDNTIFPPSKLIFTRTQIFNDCSRIE